MRQATRVVRGPVVRPRPGGSAGTAPTGPAGARPRGVPARSGEPHLDRRAALEAMARGFVLLYLEVEAGRRPRAHLEPLMAPMLFARLRDVWIRGGRPRHVVTVRLAGTHAGGCDIVAVVRQGAQCGAVALRMVAGRRGWYVEEIAVPENGPLPPPPYPVPSDDAEDDVSPVALPVARQAPAGDPRLVHPA